MRSILAVCLLCSLSLPLGAQTKSSKSCLIVNQHKHTFGENAARFTPAKPYNWIEGEYPKSVKFNHELGNKQIQQVQSAGGKVVVVKHDYTPADLEDARKQCRDFQEAK